MKKVRRVDTIFRRTSSYVVQEAKMVVYNAEIRRKAKIGSAFLFVAFLVVTIVFTLVVTPTRKINAESSPAPNFATDTIKKIKGISYHEVMIEVRKGTQNELWLYDVKSGRQRNIGLEAAIPDNVVWGVKDNYIFWLSGGKESLFIYYTDDDKRAEKNIPAFKPEKGERPKVGVWGIPWEVVVTLDNLYFYSKKTGEVFSDSNSETVEKFRYKFDLDSLIADEELVNLGFQMRKNGQEE